MTRSEKDDKRIMDGFTTVGKLSFAYDPSKDGVWIMDGTDAQVFITRNAIIQMLSELPAEPPKKADK